MYGLKIVLHRKGLSGNVSEPKKAAKLSQLSGLWKLSRANSSTGALLVLTAFVNDCSADATGAGRSRHFPRVNSRRSPRMDSVTNHGANALPCVVSGPPGTDAGLGWKSS